MPGAIVGGLLGWAFSGSIVAAGLAASVLGAVMIGASIGSLFDMPNLDLGDTTPNYSFGPISNTKSQLLPIPLVYGRCRMAGNIFLQKFDTEERQTMDMMIGLSAGPINKVVSVYADEHLLYKEDLDTYTYWIWTYTGAYTTDDEGRVHHTLGWVQISQAEYPAASAIRKEVRDINGNVVTVKILEGCSCDFYKGTDNQVADSREPDGNTYPNLAYVALTLKAQEGLSGNPVITTILEGRKVWTPSGIMYTRNPAWIVYDILTDTKDGAGIPTSRIDLDSFEAAAAYCDEIVDGDPRYTLDYILDTQKPTVDHLTNILACFGGYFIPRDKIELHIEKAGTVYKALDPDNFVKGSFSWWQKSNDDSPNRITIEWIDPDNHYEQTAAVFEWAEDIQSRGLYEKSVSLLGITRSAQVGRMGKYMIETAKNVQNFCSFAVSLQDADIEAGEIISLTYPDFTAWSDKPFRVLSVQDDGETGNVIITCAEYIASLYDDTQMAVAVPVNPNPTVTTDDIYNLQLEDIGAFNADGTWVPIIKASWQNPSDYTPKEINVRYRYNGDADWTLALSTDSIEVSTIFTMLRAGEELEVWVNCKRPNGTDTSGDVAVITVGADTTAPSAPTALTATGWFGNINLEWANPTDPDLSHVEIWENSVDDRNTAVKIAEVSGTSYQRYLGSFVVRYYWIRAVDRTGNISGYNALAGTAGNSDQENHQDFVDLVLEENPYLNEAIDDLNATIDPIKTGLGIIFDIVQPDSIDTTFPELINVTLPGLTGRLETVEVDLPGAIQRLAERMKELDADLMAQLRAVSSSAVDALLNISEIGQRITDAGIVVDPDNGEVRIWAVDQLRTEHGVRLSNAEQLISAQAGIISQTVGIADVDARIAQAVFGNVGELLVSGLEAHITSVEQELNAAKAELTQKANNIEVDEIGGRVGTAETKISGLEASVALKATQEEVDELTSRVTTAEFTVDALNGTIGSEIVAIGQEGRDLANLTAEGLVEAILNDSENRDRAKIQLATAKTEIYARVEEGLSAEAGQRTALAAVVDGNYSTYLQSTELLTTNLRAEVTQREQLQSQVDGLDGSVISLSGAVAGKADVIYSATPPEDAKNNDLWCATADSGTYKQGSFYRLVGEVWTKITDPLLLQTIDPDFEGSLAWKADQIEAVANSKNRTFRQHTAPTTGMSAGDLWFDSDDNNKAYRYNGSSWIQTDDIRIAANTASINTEAITRADADSAEARRVNVLFSGSEEDPLADPPSPTSVRGRLQTSEETLATHTSSLARYGRQLTASIEANVTESVSAPGSPTPGMVWKCTATGGAYAGKFWIWDRTSESNPYGWQEIKGVSGDLYGSVKSINASVTNLSGAIAGKSDVIYAATPPVDAKSNDIWCATANSGSYESGAFYRLSGGTWTKITDPFLVKALDENFEGSLAYDLKQLNASVGDLSTTVDEITEVSTTETAAIGSFTRNMVAQLGNQLGSGLVEDILNQADARKNAVQQYAYIRQDYNVKIEEGLLSEATAREVLATRVDANESAILSEAVSRSTADDAMSKTIDAVSAKTDKNEADIQTEQEARADADSVLSSTISTVLATANTKNKTYRQVSAPTSGMTAGDLWFDSDDSNKAYRYSGSAWVATDDTRIAANTAAIQTEQTARANADSAMASQIATLVSNVGSNTAGIQSEATARANADSAIASEVSTLSTTVGNNTSAIQTVNSSVDGIKSKHAVKIDTNGYVTGYELIGTGASSSMVFHVDNFLIGKPGASNDYPFALGVVDGVTRISMQNVFIQDAAIDTLKIKNNAVTTYVFVTGGQTSSWGNLYGTGSPTWRIMPFNNSVTVTQIVSDRPAMITFSVNWYSAEDYAGTSFRVLANTSNTLTGASAIWTKNVGGGDQINMSYTEQFQWIPSSSGTWYLYSQWLLGSGGDMYSKWNTYIRSHSLSLFHMKR